MVWIYSEDNMTDFNLFSKAPEGDLYTKWEDYKKTLKTLSPEEAKKYKVIVIGTCQEGASASEKDQNEIYMPSYISDQNKKEIEI